MAKEIEMSDLHPKVRLKSKVNDVEWVITQANTKDGIYLALVHPESTDMIRVEFNSIQEVNVYLKLA